MFNSRPQTCLILTSSIIFISQQTSDRGPGSITQLTSIPGSPSRKNSIPSCFQVQLNGQLGFPAENTRVKSLDQASCVPRRTTWWPRTVELPEMGVTKTTTWETNCSVIKLSGSAQLVSTHEIQRTFQDKQQWLHVRNWMVIYINTYTYIYIYVYIYTIYNVYGIGMHCCLHCYPCHSIDTNNAKANISTVLILTRPLGHCPLLVVIDLPKANCCQVLQCKAALVGTCWHTLAPSEVLARKCCVIPGSNAFTQK